MKTHILIGILLFLTACSMNKEELTVTGEITKISEEEKEIWIGRNPLYVDEPEEFELGEVVRITYSAPETDTDVWDQPEYEVIHVERLPNDLYTDLRETAWAYLPGDIKEEIAASARTDAHIETGISNASDPYAELDSLEYDNQEVWEVFYDSPNFIQPYKVLIDQGSLEAIGLRRPEN
ncbi:hypothetical protein [Indiicoccus explosivorum]|uniref:hypothetical protein n=1 Tax=Indiicoccus explosivorum TaxID=1917864 RepID=UPI000B42EDF2|nr:hypothetical protein [Indiicoccus explosivorum]